MSYPKQRYTFSVQMKNERLFLREDRFFTNIKDFEKVGKYLEVHSTEERRTKFLQWFDSNKNIANMAIDTDEEKRLEFWS